MYYSGTNQEPKLQQSIKATFEEGNDGDRLWVIERSKGLICSVGLVSGSAQWKMWKGTTTKYLLENFEKRTRSARLSLTKWTRNMVVGFGIG